MYPERLVCVHEVTWEQMIQALKWELRFSLVTKRSLTNDIKIPIFSRLSEAVEYSFWQWQKDWKGKWKRIIKCLFTLEQALDSLKDHSAQDIKYPWTYTFFFKIKKFSMELPSHPLLSSKPPGKPLTETRKIHLPWLLVSSFRTCF